MSNEKLTRGEKIAESIFAKDQEQKYATVASVSQNTKSDVIVIQENDFNDKEYIIRIEARDTVVGEKTPRGRIKISDAEEGIYLDADLGIQDVKSATQRVHAALFTHLVQAAKEFIEDNLVGE